MKITTNKIIKACRKEFQLSNCGFNHMPPEELVRSQWQTRTKSIFYLLYRWVIGLFFIGAVASSMSNNSTAQDWGLYFIYLTNWGILACMITGIFGVVLVTNWYFHPEYSDKINEFNEMPISFKIYWCIHNTTIVIAIIITIIYWIFLYSEKINDTNEMPLSFKIYWCIHNVSLILALSISFIYWTILHHAGIPLDAINILTHACNAIIMFIDMLIVAYPIRIFHGIQAVTVGFTYGMFSFIYHLFGGLNKNGQPYIYNVVNWNYPGYAMLTIFGSMLLAFFLHCIIFFLYKIRVLIYTKFYLNTFDLSTNSSAASLSPVKNQKNMKKNLTNNFGGSQISMVFGSDHHHPEYTNAAAGGFSNDGFKGSREKF